MTLSRSESSSSARVLSLFADVRSNEALTALLMMLNVFLLLAAYYVIKPVREALILAHPDGAEYKAYLGGAIAVALLIAVPAYARFADALPRLKLVVSVTLFFGLHLLAFYVAGTRYAGTLGLALSLGFYVWVGIFNMMVVAQFWSFANDIYSEEQGKRLFPLVALGASLGAALGSKFAGALIPVLGVYAMLLVGAVLLGVCAALFWIVELRTHGQSHKAAPSPRGKISGAFDLVLSERYLLGLAFFALIFSCVNTNSEYLLGKLVKAAASEEVQGGRLTPERIGDFIGATYGNFFFAVNVASVLCQAFLVSRLVRRFGLERALFVMPAVALGGALLVALVPKLSVVRVGKVVENATDYSLNNTLRQMLWLVTTREQKYKAKQAVDTFFVRSGDMLSALLVWLLVSQLSMSIPAFALMNAALVLLWFLVTRIVVREHQRLSRFDPAES